MRAGLLEQVHPSLFGLACLPAYLLEQSAAAAEPVHATWVAAEERKLESSLLAQRRNGRVCASQLQIAESRLSPLLVARPPDFQSPDQATAQNRLPPVHRESAY